MARYPHARWRPVARYQPGGHSCQSMAVYRRVQLHTAVSNGESLYGLFAQDGNPVAHFYVYKNGTCEQYVDTRHRASAGLDSNPDSISIETWDGYPHGWANGSDVPEWTNEQLERIADIIDWANEVHGIPVRACPSSKPGTTGVCYHRQGCDPWRVAGGQHWSHSYGKVCPGDRRVAQVPAVVQMAQGKNPELGDDVDKHDVKAAIRDYMNDINYADLDQPHVKRSVVGFLQQIDKNAKTAANQAQTARIQATEDQVAYSAPERKEVREVLHAVQNLDMDPKKLASAVAKQLGGSADEVKIEAALRKVLKEGVSS
ncbi:MAG: N-acetylmuramoyl-L-alanine amidase [Nocardioidaceae bacterium]